MYQKVTNQNAILFHSAIATRFDTNYQYKKSFIERFTIWTKLIDKYNLENKRIIDIGCGSGILSHYLATKGNIVTGIDGSSKMIDLCQEKFNSLCTNPTFIQKSIPFNPNDFMQFDGIICSSVIEYIKEIDLTLDLFNDLLVESGHLIISVPNGLSIYRKLEKVFFKILKRPKYYKYVYNIYSFDKFKHLIENKGFKIDEVQYFGRSTSVLDNLTKVKTSKYFNNLYVCVCTKVNSKKENSHSI